MAALAAVVGFAVMLATMGVMAPLLGYEPKPIMGIPSIETGVFGGILIGAVAAILFNRYYRLQLPAYLGFFAGKRSVPILTAFAAIFVGIILSFVWPPIGHGIDAFSHWAATAHPATAFALYGVVERSLIPFGLHHIWNVPFFFEVGSYRRSRHREDHPRRDQSLRRRRSDRRESRRRISLQDVGPSRRGARHLANGASRRIASEIGGIMISAALTSFLTGITEPIEFAFLFVAPVLYGIHALLAGAAYWVAIELGIHHSTTFSHGLIDYIVLYPHAQRGWLLVPVGLVWARMYYLIFRTLILKFDLKTPGRETDDAVQSAAARADAGGPASSDSMAARLVAAFGGESNIRSLDACITRLRMELVDNARANPDALRALGASGVMVVPGGMQAVFGTRSENLKTDMEEYMKSGGAAVATAPAPRRLLRARAMVPSRRSSGHAHARSSRRSVARRTSCRRTSSRSRVFASSFAMRITSAMRSSRRPARSARGASRRMSCT